MRVKLTDRVVKACEAPNAGVVKLWDSEVPGFICRVSAGGTKAFLFDYRLGRQRRQFQIGRFPSWSALRARKRAQALRVSVDQGRDPAAERSADREAPLMTDLLQRMQVVYEANAPRTRADRRQMWEKTILPALGRMRVDAVQFRDVEVLHRTKTQQGHPYAANRLVEVLRHAFNRAIRWKLRPDNPAAHIRRNQEQPHSRYLTQAEFPRFMEALEELPNQRSADALRLLALTGARMGEVLGARWDQFDLDEGVWVKPAAMTKQRRLHRVLLAPGALAVLQRMQGQSTGPILFPGSGRTGAQTELRRSFKAACRIAEIAALRVHDLRHSFASLLISTGSDLATVSKLLGHTQAQTTLRYAHLHAEVERSALIRFDAMVTGYRTAAE